MNTPVVGGPAMRESVPAGTVRIAGASRSRASLLSALKSRTSTTSSTSYNCMPTFPAPPSSAPLPSHPTSYTPAVDLEMDLSGLAGPDVAGEFGAGLATTPSSTSGAGVSSDEVTRVGCGVGSGVGDEASVDVLNDDAVWDGDWCVEDAALTPTPTFSRQSHFHTHAGGVSSERRGAEPSGQPILLLSTTDGSSSACAGVEGTTFGKGVYGRCDAGGGGVVGSASCSSGGGSGSGGCGGSSGRNFDWQAAGAQRRKSGKFKSPLLEGAE
jgi:hypothetical protein